MGHELKDIATETLFEEEEEGEQAKLKVPLMPDEIHRIMLAGCNESLP